MKTILLISSLTLFISACSKTPEILIETKEVKIPVRCNVTIPKKPQYTGNFESARKLAEYYLQIEDLLRICTNE